MEKPAVPPKKESTHSHSSGIIETAARLNRDYIPWDEIRTRDNLGFPPEDLWRVMESFRKVTGYSVRIGGQVFSWNLTAGILSKLHAIDMKHNGGSTFGHGLNRHTRRIYAVGSAMEEAIASSAIAGSAIQNPNAKKFLREGRAGRNPSEDLVGRTYALLNKAREYADREFGETMLLDLDREVCGPGARYRISDTVESEEHSREPELEPFPKRNIPRAVKDISAFAADDSIHPLIRAFAMEYMIMRVQPFESRNGPVARAAASWCMARNGYGIDLYLAISSVRRSRSAKYRRSFMISEAEKDDMTYAIAFGLESMLEAVSDFTAYAERKNRENSDVLEGLATEDLNSRQRSLLGDMARSAEAFTIEEIAAKHQVSYQTARSDLLLLEGRKLVKKGPKNGHRDTYLYSGADR